MSSGAGSSLVLFFTPVALCSLSYLAVSFFFIQISNRQIYVYVGVDGVRCLESI
jgi:hypothetical protein